ncbi:MAG TPA: glutaminyl-peptide cyclotransferase [Cytophagaceae bacterium]|jgi:glutamine cyclotransferase|nr:glutaminyl-peptide cyclotransferase [Cytophagaceae bacterium]
MNKFLVFACILLLLLACENKKKPETIQQQVPVQSLTVPLKQLHYTIVNRYPHDEMAFTEGFLFHQGELYESTGSPDNLPQTQSFIGIVDLKTGKINKKVELDRAIYFGEGIAILNGKVYQLTYKNKQGFLYDLKSFKKLGQFSYDNEEGWGMTTDGSSLIMSDGSSRLTYLDPFTMKPSKTLTVTENDTETIHLNELEYIKGYIYANIWLTNYIVKIDPQDGKVVAKLDLSNLMNEIKYTHPKASEMNGIAFNPANGHLYMTGKMWPTIYELDIVE